jgi:D-beta-D-heptose 7-phosphate kinase/D-beta-D-heptose 1-phosphate adenosyltransferase
VHVQDVDERPGGAGNVALNLKGLGCRVILIGMIGDDEAGKSLESSLMESGVECYLQRVPDQPTITKLRVFGRNQQLIRLDFEQSFHQTDKSELLAAFQQQLPTADAVVFSDYSKGVFPVMGEMIRAAKTQSKLTFVDPKNKDLSHYQMATLLTPNLKEFEQAVGPCHSESEIVDQANKLIAEHGLQGLLVTRGADGMSLIHSQHPPLHLKAHSSEVYDVSGAGDTVISVLAATIAAGYDPMTAAKLANLAAGVVVRKVGVAPITIPELRRSLQQFHGCDRGVLSEEQLLLAVADARAHGEKIVMTNGCFDLLHAGHIAYLEEAANLGDRLIIAVNSDESVAGLKGPERPINPLDHRMTLLSALRCVDWVVPFTETTPERLISRILPDVLVKGGDYQVHEIAGSQQVMENGGAVRILSFVPGHSTSETIQRIRGEELCT